MEYIVKIFSYLLLSVLVVNIFYVVSIPFHSLSSSGDKLFTKEGVFADMEGNKYKTVTINGVEWAAENIRSSKFKDGREIFHATNMAEWDSANKFKIPAWANYNFDSKMDAKYGKLYNYYVVLDIVGIAPAGWHLPSIKDYFQLVKFAKIKGISRTQKLKIPEYFDGENDAEYMRSEKQAWVYDCERIYSLERYFPIDKGTNETGFGALPGGYLFADSNGTSFLKESFYSGWWGADNTVMLIDEHEEVYLVDSKNISGFYIRLIR